MKQRISLLIIFIFCHLALMAQAGLDVSGETDGGDGTWFSRTTSSARLTTALWLT